MAPSLRSRKSDADSRVTLFELEEPEASTSSPAKPSRKRSVKTEAADGEEEEEVKPKPRKVTKHNKALPPADPPKRFVQQFDILVAQRERIVAPVDTMGCADAGKEVDAEPRPDTSEADRRYLMLSSQTKDEVTAAATAKLRADLPGGLTVDSILAATDEQIQQCIAKVGFWRQKTSYIKRSTQILKDEHGSDVPKTIEELLALPGVGPKMGFLALLECHGIQLGIGVDTHVHRLSNRLGWMKTKDAEETRVTLESWLPKHLHGTINKTLVGFGQVVCLPVGPRCDQCDLGAVKGLCPSKKAVSASPRSSPAKSRGTIRPKDEPLEIALEESKPVLPVPPALIDGQVIEGAVIVKNEDGPTEIRKTEAKIEAVETTW